jgi:hypothetical protein
VPVVAGRAVGRRWARRRPPDRRRQDGPAAIVAVRRRREVQMATAATPYPVRLEFTGDTRIERWRPLVQWLLVIPQLLVVSALQSLRGILTLISLFTVLFTEAIPRPIFDLIAMTFRYEWRVTSYGLFMRESYPPFDFTPAAEQADDPVADHASVSIAYPERLHRWMPFVKWFLAIPHVVALAVLSFVGVLAVVAGFVVVVVTGNYPERIRDYLVGVYRWNLRVQAYVGLLTDRYPPFSLRA